MALLTGFQTLSKELEDEKAALIKNTATRSEHEVKRNDLENLLTTNLRKRYFVVEIDSDESLLTEEYQLYRQTELNEQIKTIDVGDEAVQDEKGNRQELERVKASISSIDKQLKEVDTQLETIKSGLDKKKDQIEDLKKAESKSNSRMQKQAKEMERLLNQRILANQKKDEYERKLSELGSVPESAFTGFVTFDFRVARLLLMRKQLQRWTVGAIDEGASWSQRKTEEIQSR